MANLIRVLGKQEIQLLLQPNCPKNPFVIEVENLAGSPISIKVRTSDKETFFVE